MKNPVELQFLKQGAICFWAENENDTWPIKMTVSEYVPHAHGIRCIPWLYYGAIPSSIIFPADTIVYLNE